MGIEGLLIFIIIGAIAGWLAGTIYKGYGFGLLGNIVVGIVGAALASWIFPKLGLWVDGGVIAQIIWATLGAIVLLFLISLVRKAT